MKLSNTKVACARRCWKKYEFQYVLGIKRKVKKVQLERGSWLHTLLEVFYANDPDKVIEVTIRGRKRKVRVGTDWRRAHKALTKWFNSLFDEERDELGDLPTECERIMLSYLAYYKEENEYEETIAVELDEWVELPNGDKFNFIIDRVLRKSDGGVWLRDYKSVGSFMDPDFMLVDAQLARYMWGFRRIPRFKELATDLRGVEFDEIRTKPPTIPELVLAKGQKKGGVQELTRRANLDTDHHTYMTAIAQAGFNPRDYKDVLTRLRAREQPGTHPFFRRTVLPKDAPLVKQMMVDMLVTAKEIRARERSGHFPRTPDKSCSWGCDFYEPCVAQLHGSEIDDIIELKYDYKERES